MSIVYTELAADVTGLSKGLKRLRKNIDTNHELFDKAMRPI